MVPLAKTISRLWWRFLLSGLLLAGATACAGPVGEYQVKAVFLYNFTKFVQWPGAAMVPTNSPLAIGIVGEDPFGTMLEEIARQDPAPSHSVVIRRFRSGEPIGECQILFIARSEKDRLEALLDQVKGRPVLTVAETARAAEQGAMINLLVIQGTVKMEINPAAADSAGLHMSSKLLNLARLVNTTPVKP